MEDSDPLWLENYRPEGQSSDPPLPSPAPYTYPRDIGELFTPENVADGILAIHGMRAVEDDLNPVRLQHSLGGVIILLGFIIRILCQGLLSFPCLLVFQLNTPSGEPGLASIDRLVDVSVDFTSKITATNYSASFIKEIMCLQHRRRPLMVRSSQSHLCFPGTPGGLQDAFL